MQLYKPSWQPYIFVIEMAPSLETTIELQIISQIWHHNQALFTRSLFIQFSSF